MSLENELNDGFTPVGKKRSSSGTSTGNNSDLTAKIQGLEKIRDQLFGQINQYEQKMKNMTKELEVAKTERTNAHNLLNSMLG